MHNSISEAILTAPSVELEELARAIWLEFDLKFSSEAQYGHSGDRAEIGNVMELLVTYAKQNRGVSK